MCLYIFWILLCALPLLALLLLFLPVRLILCADPAVTLELKLLFIRIKRYPTQRRIRPRDYSARRLAKKEKKAQKKQKKKPAPTPQKSPKKRTVAQKIRRVRAICAVLLRHTKKRLVLRTARLHIRVATGDPAGTAIAFGAVSQGVSYLLAALDEITRLKTSPGDVSVEPDFLAERSTMDVKLVFSIRVWAILATAFSLFLTKFSAKRVKKARDNQQKSSPKKGT